MSEDSRAQPASPCWRDNPFAQQIPAEIGSLQGALLAQGGPTSYLEVGACMGWSMFLVAEVMPKGGKIRLIDFGRIDETTDAEGVKGFDIKPYLETKVQALRERGFDVEVFYGDSHSIEAIKWARDNGPYQLVGIDGDHSYEGARADWENYAHLGACVWLHDIANIELGVMRLWQELQGAYNGRTVEFVYPMGIGVVNRLGPPAIKQAAPETD